MRRAPKVLLSAHQRTELHATATDGRDRLLRRRCKIIIRAADGARDIDIAVELAICRQTAAMWRRRFLARGVAGLQDRRPPRLQYHGPLAATRAGVVS